MIHRYLSCSIDIYHVLCFSDIYVVAISILRDQSSPQLIRPCTCASRPFTLTHSFTLSTSLSYYQVQQYPPSGPGGYQVTVVDSTADNHTVAAAFVLVIGFFCCCIWPVGILYVSLPNPPVLRTASCVVYFIE